MSRYYNDELCHHGIKGMKWGVRRFQNSDGTYTSAGKNRRTLADGRALRAKEEAATAHKLANKYTGAMDAKAAKRQAQADAKGTRFAKARAIRAKEEAVTAHKLANRYTNAMDAKATKRQAQADSSGLSDRQKTALKVGATVAIAGLAAYGGYKIFGGKHNATTAAVTSAVNKGKTATANLMKKAGNKAYNKAVSEVKKTPDRIKRAAAETKSAVKEGAKKGVRDGAKVVGSGAAIYAAQKALEKRYGKQNAEKIIQYGRQPLKKK